MGGKPRIYHAASVIDALVLRCHTLDAEGWMVSTATFVDLRDEVRCQACRVLLAKRLRKVKP